MFTFNDMKNCATEAWGPLGASVADRWLEFNGRYFDGRLKPIPLVITNTLPFGRRIAFCSCGYGRTITLNVPKDHAELLADNSTLLHEMVHQCLFERGEDASHASAGWRNSIMRLHRQITGKAIWAGRSTTARRQVNGTSRVVRINQSNPETGDVSLPQGQIARWPHSVGISLGPLGVNMELHVTAADR